MIWKIDQTYVDSGVKIRDDGYSADDQFASALSLDRNQNWGIKNAGGIRTLSSGMGNRKDKSLTPAALFLITTQYGHIFHNPWEDFIDYTTGTIFYWGDAKYEPGKNVDQWPGNFILKNIYENVLVGNRDKHPPILYFMKEKPGTVTFKGLCVLDGMDKTWFIDNGNRVVNYRFKLAILNIEEVDSEWLCQRARNRNSEPNHVLIPPVWKQYIKTGFKDRLTAWNTKIRSKEQQQPDPSGPGQSLLERLELINPFEFEKIICHLLESYNTIVHKVLRTRNVRDGGFDMEGEFILPVPFNYPIGFKGEVKRHKSGIGPRDVSRLVARLTRGEYGLFFTTSYFTADAQKEVIIDNYPVRLISGADLYDFFYEAKMLDENGIKVDDLLMTEGDIEGYNKN
ncbi:MAG TPA: restriction endonuclease [Syntrophorhabdaceae bacterium]|nr:restriction endonuclease [Syntrophorhabdaceae bacterium]